MLRLSLYVSCLLSLYLTHECIHHEIAKNIKIRKLEPPPEEEGRNLQSETWRQIKIVTDYTLFNMNATATQAVKEVFEGRVLEKLKRILKVTGNTRINRFSSTPCDNIFKVPTSFGQTVTEADLIIDFSESNPFGTP